MKFFEDKWVGPDKVKHAAVGVIVAVLIGGLFSPLGGLVAAVGVGAAKEVYDYASAKGTPSFQDFAVTAAGGAFGALVAYFL